jgi:hypothetical protein
MLVIKVKGRPGSIVIEDGSGNPVGGDLMVRSGERVCWVNDTGRKCTLTFRELKLGADQPAYGSSKKPFAGTRLRHPIDVPASGWCGRVEALDRRKGRQASYVKYDVTVTGGRSGSLHLDPVIIIDR